MLRQITWTTANMRNVDGVQLQLVTASLLPVSVGILQTEKTLLTANRYYNVKKFKTVALPS